MLARLVRDNGAWLVRDNGAWLVRDNGTWPIKYHGLWLVRDLLPSDNKKDVCNYNQEMQIILEIFTFHLQSNTRLGLNCQTPVKKASGSKAQFSPSKGHLTLKFIYHWRLSSIEGHLPSIVIFHQRLSSINNRQLFSISGHLPWKVVSPSKDFCHQRSSFIKNHLQLKFTFNWRQM